MVDDCRLKSFHSVWKAGVEILNLSHTWSSTVLLSEPSVAVPTCTSYRQSALHMMWCWRGGWRTRKVLLQCPQETRAPDGCGSRLAGTGWAEPRLIILLLGGDKHTKSTRTRQMTWHNLWPISRAPRSRLERRTTGDKHFLGWVRISLLLLRLMLLSHSRRPRFGQSGRSGGMWLRRSARLAWM